jgi:hypothetical protein
MSNNSEAALKVLAEAMAALFEALSAQQVQIRALANTIAVLLDAKSQGIVADPAELERARKKLAELQTFSGKNVL